MLEPVVVPTEKDGSTYYYSVMVVRADSGIRTLEDMKGHSLALGRSELDLRLPDPECHAEGEGHQAG